MNTAHLKNYAPRARKDFIAAVTARAAKFGITAKQIEPIVEQGDVALIGDKAYPRPVAENRRKLEARIEQQGFARVMEAMAYTWFNRFMAIRYMELHGYLDHGRRVLSHPEKQRAFEILEACTEVELPGVDKDRVVELKLDGSKDEELYRLLLLGQCHALHQAMPFLFEAIEDDTELLLPDNLTKTDSLVRHLIDDIPEDNWDNIEIIGWLYQFYISEKKDQVVGKVVKSEDIPAATQLFTPNWIVKYMVQNSLGAQWLATYPDSKLEGQMQYYIEPAEQTDKVKTQLAAITPRYLNPEELTLIDPACGSGHILVEAYELLKAIYLERGYRPRDVPQLILQKNLFGLDIDERAAQLTGFALMMKGRADDRRLFQKPIKLNVMALVDSAGFDAEALAQGVKLLDYGLQPSDLTELKRLFEHATTFGSLIEVPEGLAEKLPALKRLTETVSQDMFVLDAIARLAPLVQQAELLAAQYDSVVANPPYMGAGSMNKDLKAFCRIYYPDYKLDLYSAFIKSLFRRCSGKGIVSTIVMHSWMFVLKFESMRSDILEKYAVTSMLHLGTRAFEETSGEVVQTVSFSARNLDLNGNSYGTYIRLVEGPGVRKRAALISGQAQRYIKLQKSFASLPGKIVCYWASDGEIEELIKGQNVAKYGEARHGLVTSDNNKFLRYWWEVDVEMIGYGCRDAAASVESRRKWFPYNKGGSYRKWYGNDELVVNWLNDGEEIVNLAREMYGSPTKKVTSRNFYFKSSLTWSALSSDNISMRANGPGFLFDSKGSSVFFDNEEDTLFFLVYLNSRVATRYLNLLCPTLDYNAGSIAKVPVPSCSREEKNRVIEIGLRVRHLAKSDWEAQMRAPGFSIWTPSTDSLLEKSLTAIKRRRLEIRAEVKLLILEAENIFLKYLQASREDFAEFDERDFGLPVTNAPEFATDFVEYVIGCMMGRYSLDTPGLIYAHSGNEGFDPGRYPTFLADDDGIVPITDTDWFPDDAAHRVIEFISVAWDKSHLEANLTFLADNLSPKKNEASRETIRRYLCDSFFKDHLQTYKKRPIYWLFSSGKHKAFQCLVYLHRYNKGTLARMRTVYVIPLQGKMSSRIDQLDSDIAATSSTAHRKKLEKERDKLAKQRVELQGFDEKLRHCADQRISLDLDDGVKVNYGKFGDLLTEVKAITGTKAT